MAAYRGKLSVKQTVEGMNAARQNAARLLEDAKLLFDAQRFPTAASLAILSIEEAGKSELLRAIPVTRNAAALKQRWKDYRNHQSKNITWILPVLVMQGARRMGELDVMFDPNSDHPKVLDRAKQLGFYSDCFGNCRWWDPAVGVTEQMANGLIMIAEISAKNPQIVQRELELWIEYVGIGLGTPLTPEQEHSFFHALSREGFLPCSMEEAERFFGLA
jgi:AbiV family abortive infection protein